MSSELHANIVWIEQFEEHSVDTMAYLAVTLDDRPIWPVWGDPDTNLDVFGDDILAYLTENWAILLLRQTYPHTLQPALPSRLLAEAQDAAAGGVSEGSEPLVEAVQEFAESHDFSHAIAGQFGLPSLWMVRRGDAMLLETNGQVVEVSIQTWIAFAEQLGDAIANRLRERCGKRFARLISAWERRDTAEPATILSLATGQRREISEALLRDRILLPETSVLTAANDDDELRIAARMMGPIPYLQIQMVLSATASIPAGDSEKLDALTHQVRESLKELSPLRVPHSEGVHAASAARNFLGLSIDGRVDPFAVLDRLGVPIFNRGLDMATLDAIAVWGRSHGPAVLMNTDSKRFGTRGAGSSVPAARATVAHELCHLLLDRGLALAAVDILNGRVPASFEKRARAFAAEFLLPARTALDIWRRSDLAVSRSGVSAILSRLSNRFGVSRAMAAWQLDHGLLGSDYDVLFWLDELVPQRREQVGRR